MTLSLKIKQALNSKNADLLEKLSSHDNICVRMMLAINKNITPSILEKLSQDSEYIVRKFVAANSNTSDTVLTLLSKDISFPVRLEVAKNKNTPSKVLTQLSKTPLFAIRIAIAQNKNGIKLLPKLCWDVNPAVRLAVVNNTNVSQKILHILSSDPDLKVRTLALKNDKNIIIPKWLSLTKKVKLKNKQKLPRIKITNLNIDTYSGWETKFFSIKRKLHG